jgi:hypothetical protein
MAITNYAFYKILYIDIFNLTTVILSDHLTYLFEFNYYKCDTLTMIYKLPLLDFAGGGRSEKIGFSGKAIYKILYDIK